MEELYDCGYVKTLGTCDLDKETLEKLYEWARVCTRKWFAIGMIRL